MIRYDTVYVRALNSWRDGRPNLAHGTETKKKKEKQKPNSSEETIPNDDLIRFWKLKVKVITGRSKGIHVDAEA